MEYDELYQHMILTNVKDYFRDLWAFRYEGMLIPEAEMKVLLRRVAKLVNEDDNLDSREQFYGYLEKVWFEFEHEELEESEEEAHQVAVEKRRPTARDWLLFGSLFILPGVVGWVAIISYLVGLFI